LFGCEIPSKDANVTDPACRDLRAHPFPRQLVGREPKFIKVPIQIIDGGRGRAAGRVPERCRGRIPMRRVAREEEAGAVVRGERVILLQVNRAIGEI